MDTSPAPNLEMVHPKFFLGRSKALFDSPPSEGNLQHPSNRGTVASDDSVTEKVLYFAGANVAADDQRVCVLTEVSLDVGPAACDEKEPI